MFDYGHLDSILRLLIRPVLKKKLKLNLMTSNFREHSENCIKSWSLVNISLKYTLTSPFIPPHIADYILPAAWWWIQTDLILPTSVRSNRTHHKFPYFHLSIFILDSRTWRVRMLFEILQVHDCIPLRHKTRWPTYIKFLRQTSSIISSTHRYY